MTATRTPYRNWALAWLGGPLIGIANGAARQSLYARRLGELRAHQVSTVTCAAAVAAYVRAVDRRWPIAHARDAALIGAGWVALTAAFEFGFGHYVAREPWRELLRDYDLSRGRVWGLALLSIGVAPSVVRATRVARKGQGVLDA